MKNRWRAFRKGMRARRHKHLEIGWF